MDTHITVIIQIMSQTVYIDVLSFSYKIVEGVTRNSKSVAQIEMRIQLARLFTVTKEYHIENGAE